MAGALSLSVAASSDALVELTRSICPLCKRVLDAEVVIREGRVLIRKQCPEHGLFEGLVSSDADLYLSQQRFNRPGTRAREIQTEVVEGCPLDCGLCPDHRQHACLGIIEVNSGCNLDCPICFADSGHQPDGFTLTRDQIGQMLDAYLRAEGEPEVVMLSGGEPTIHPDILALIALAREKGIEHVILNTNGIRLARDRRFVEQLAGLRPHLSFQLDGLQRATHLALRGRDLRRDKLRALDVCAEAGLSVTLVAAVERGVNEHEVGEILRFGVSHPAVRSVVYQPVTHAGRHLEFDPLQRLTNANVINALADQVPEWLRPDDFLPVPCCYPNCRSMCYPLVHGEDLVPLTRLLEVEPYLDYASNRLLPDPALRQALEAMFSASAVPGVERLLLAYESCGIDPAAMAAAAEDPLGQRHVFAIVVQDFQDPYRPNVRQVMKCCTVEIVPDGRLIPFCAYNAVGYRELVRSGLSGVAVPPLAPNARPLLPLLRDTAHGSKTVR